MSKIQILQNHILRCILKVRRLNGIPTAHVNEMYLQLEFLKTKDIYFLNLFKFLHFILYKRIDVFMENFSSHLPNSNYNIRNSIINLPGVRTETEKISTVFNCCKLIKTCDPDFLLPQSLSRLKNKYKATALSSYLIDD